MVSILNPNTARHCTRTKQASPRDHWSIKMTGSVLLTIPLPKVKVSTLTCFYIKGVLSLHVMRRVNICR